MSIYIDPLLGTLPVLKVFCLLVCVQGAGGLQCITFLLSGYIFFHSLQGPPPPQAPPPQKKKKEKENRKLLECMVQIPNKPSYKSTKQEVVPYHLL